MAAVSTKLFQSALPPNPNPPLFSPLRCLWREPFQVSETYKSLHKSFRAQIPMSPLTGEPSTAGSLLKKKKATAYLIPQQLDEKYGDI